MVKSCSFSLGWILEAMQLDIWLSVVEISEQDLQASSSVFTSPSLCIKRQIFFIFLSSILLGIRGIIYNTCMHIWKIISSFLEGINTELLSSV